jgi:hypothetical protein
MTRTSRTPKNARAKAGRKKAAQKKRASTPDWGPAFLAAFEQTGMVTKACEVADVGRRTVYDRRQRDEDFAIAWHEVEERTTEILEREAFRRAAAGVQRPVLHKGEQVTIDGEPLWEREFSDTLLIFLLKARRPEIYRENVKVDHGGQVTHRHGVLGDREPVQVSKERRDRIARELLEDLEGDDARDG